VLLWVQVAECEVDNETLPVGVAVNCADVERDALPESDGVSSEGDSCWDTLLDDDVDRAIVKDADAERVTEDVTGRDFEKVRVLERPTLWLAVAVIVTVADDEIDRAAVCDGVTESEIEASRVDVIDVVCSTVNVCDALAE